MSWLSPGAGELSGTKAMRDCVWSTGLHPRSLGSDDEVHLHDRYTPDFLELLEPVPSAGEGDKAALLPRCEDEIRSCIRKLRRVCVLSQREPFSLLLY